jgi:hypothetical protein
VDAMAEALSADPADLERMGRAGAETIAEKHDASTQAKKLAELFGLLPQKLATRNETLLVE